MLATAKRELNFTNKRNGTKHHIPMGEQVIVKMHTVRLKLSDVYANIIDKEKQIIVKAWRLHQYFEEFEPFDMEDLKEAVTDGKCPSLTGETVEPDGHDSHGFPSILMACGWM